MQRLIDANRLLSEDIKTKYYHLPNGDIAIPIIDIEHAPTVDAVPVVHGRWEYFDIIYDESTWVCSICKEPWTLIDGTPQENGMKYCPTCGAKMDLKEEHNGTDNP